jgi:hypothetical protein
MLLLISTIIIKISFLIWRFTQSKFGIYLYGILFKVGYVHARRAGKENIRSLSLSFLSKENNIQTQMFMQIERGRNLGTLKGG